MGKESSTEIRAAGGIVTGVGSNSGKLAVVHRRRYRGEIGLPKGKLDIDESAESAALREVEEETGLRAKLLRVAGTTHYTVGGKPKTVTYFLMEAAAELASPCDSKEIEGVEWLTPKEAIAALTHEDDRELVAKLFNIQRVPI